MFKRAYLAIGLSLVLALAVACGRSQPVQPSEAPAADAVQQPVATSQIVTPQAPPATVAPTFSAPLPEVPSATPFRDGDDNKPNVTVVPLSPQREALPTVEVVKILKPSIVQITTETLTVGMFNQPVPSRGVGTGIILSEDGLILTNNHVIDGAQRIEVTLLDGRTFAADPVGTDFQTDLAVVRIDAHGLPPAELGDSSELQVGEDVIAIGHALGLPGGPTVSKGVVSALGRSIDTDQNTIVDLIQTDAEINPGNSGGALVNDRAQVIGINTAIIQSGRGIGFAINISDAKQVVAQLVEKGYVDRGFLGVGPVNLTPGLANRFGIPTMEGIFIVRVVQGRAADQAGIREGDVIVKLGDSTIANTGEMSKFLIAHPPGEIVAIELFRDGSLLTGEITLGERPR